MLRPPETVVHRFRPGSRSGHVVFTGRCGQRVIVAGMAKPTVFLLVGLPHAGLPLLLAGLEAHRDTLEGSGIRLPATSVDEMFRAAVELRREHRAWGLRRKDVEGTWARVARRVMRKPQRAAVLGHELLSGADRDQIALLLDGLRGTAVHVVVTVAAPDPLAGLVPTELDLGDVLDRWRTAVKAPDRVHLLVVDPADPLPAWTALGDLAGFDGAALPMSAAGDVAPALDAGTLRLLAGSTGALLDHDDLVDLAEHWAKQVAEGGYDVHGDPRGLVPDRPALPTDPSRAMDQVRVDVLRAALGEAVAEVARLRGRLADRQVELSEAARRPRRRFGS